MKSFSLSIPLLLATAASYVSAHGIVSSLTIDGKYYQGDLPNAPDNPSIIRQVADVGPVKGAMNANITCGLAATFAALNGPVNPGSVLQLNWTGGNLSPWPHNTGPLMTYMTNCGSTTCDKYDPTNAQWFKINQQGQMSNGSWAQLFLSLGQTAQVTIPPTLAPGNYIIRYEIIALHLAVNLGGAEFYPSCIQVIVGGNQTGGPAPSELVAFPGAYKDTDPGILDPDVYNPGANYTFPGPPVAAFVSGGSSSSGSSGGSGGSGSSTTSGAPPASTSSAPGKSCKLKKRSLATRSLKRRSTLKLHPRHWFSRRRH